MIAPQRNQVSDFNPLQRGKKPEKPGFSANDRASNRIVIADQQVESKL